MSSIVERQSRMELERYRFAAENPKPLILVSAKPYRNKSFSIIGWTGPRVKGVLVRRKYKENYPCHVRYEL